MAEASVRRKSDHDGVRALLRPASVAIVGASPRLESLSGRPMANLLTQGFTGTVYPVNPRYDAIAGLSCYAGLADLPTPPDLVMVMVGAQQVFSVLDQAVACGSQAAIVFGGGFAELDAEGAGRQRELANYAAKGLRICGPNCNGVFNVSDSIALGFSPAFERPVRRGKIALLCQSGAVATSIASRGVDRGIGFSQIIATGNEADLEVSDFVEYLIDDPATGVIALFVEGLKDVPRFLRGATRALECGKPLVMMKVGRTAAGERVALSHTGSMAGTYEILSGALRQHGVLLADRLEDLLDRAQVFATGRKPGDGGLAIASISGGLATVLADACEVDGVRLAAFGAQTTERLTAALPGFANIANPLDVTGQVVNEPAAWEETLRAITADDGVDVVLSGMSITANQVDRRLSQAIVEAATDSAQLHVCTWCSGSPAGSGYEVLRDSNVPVFLSPEAAVQAIAAWRHYWTTRTRRLAARVPAVPASASSSMVQAGEHSGWDLLRVAGVAIPGQAVVRDAAGLETALSGLAFPLVLKLQSAAVQHKTEANALRLGIRSAADAHAVFDAIIGQAGALPGPDEGVLVQEMVRGRRELIISTRMEPGVGLAVFLGIGGIFSEVFRDTSVRLAPLSPLDVEEMTGELRSRAIFGAVRGLGPIRPDAIREVLIGLSCVAAQHAASVREIELNPVIVSDDGATLTAVDLLISRV